MIANFPENPLLSFVRARRHPNGAENTSGSLATRGGGKSRLCVERQLLGEIVT